MPLTEELLPRYQQIAQHWTLAIERGSLNAGDRLPSVRRLCEQFDVSLTTALAVYRWLEERGWVEARPKSGYFVAKRSTRLAEPQTRAPLDEPQVVGINERVMRFLSATRQPHALSLGAACPGPELFPAAALQKLLAQLAKEYPTALTQYSLNAAGHPALRTQIARRAAHYGVQLSPDEIIITNGCLEAINLALRVVTRPGDTVAIESPTYYGILQIIESLGLKALEIPTHPREGVSLEALELATREAGAVQACLFILNFNNPLGSLMSAERKAALVKLLNERNIPLIEDDIYGDLYLEGNRPGAAKSADVSGNVLLCGSFTKCLAPGLRIGWIAPGRFKTAVELLKFQNTVATSELPQLVIAHYMESGAYERHLRRLREQFRRQVNRVSHAIADHFPLGTRITRPSGGFVLWVELPAPLSGRRLYQAACAEHIVVAPGDIFSTQGLYERFVRINCGLPWTAEIDRGLRRLGELAKELLA